MKFIYTVWFRNLSLAPDDPDREWPACFVVESLSQASASVWGDHLAQKYATATAQEVCSSTTEPFEGTALPGVEKLPVFAEGYEASDEEIGW